MLKKASDSRFKLELSDALSRLQSVLDHPSPPQVVAADSADAPDPEVDTRLSTVALKSLSVDSIYAVSRPRVQAALSSRVACVEAVAVRAALLQSGDVSGSARFVDRWQKGASSWLHASRKDARQHLQNAHFRVAVGGLLGVNCFPEVDRNTPCPRCPNTVGSDMGGHMLQCKAVYTGGNNKRHNAVQQDLVFWLRLAGANVVCTPGVTAFTGAEPCVASHAGRMIDIGARGLDNGPDIALDLCVSDCGTGSPPLSFRSGAKSEAKGRAKRRKYVARFPSIPVAELCCPSYGRTGSKNLEAVVLQKRIINALAAADTTVSRLLVAARFSQAMSVAVQRAVAFNILEFRYTVLPKGRVGGLAAPVPGGGDWDDDEPVPEAGGLGFQLPVPVLVPGPGVVAVGAGGPGLGAAAVVGGL